MTMKWIIPVVLPLALAKCHGPDPAAPLSEDEDRGLDVWEGTPWRALFLEARGLGGRAELSGLVADGRLEVRPFDARPWPVYTNPACSVSDDPSPEESRGYLNCLDREREDRSDRHPLDEYFFYESWSERPRYLLTFEEDAGMWHMWTIFWNGCGNAHNEAEALGLIRRR